MRDILEKMQAILPKEEIHFEEPLKKHTTFRIGGPAAYFVTPREDRELTGLCLLCKEEQIPFFILGNGSNLLVRDSGFEGMVIAMSRYGSGIQTKGGQIRAASGVLLSAIAKTALDQGLTGLEFAAGIPGSLGGAVVMNAGAYGSEMKNVLSSVKVMDSERQIRTLSVEELELGYRTSCIRKNDFIVLEAVLDLKTGEKDEIKARMEELASLRKSKQPLEYPSAGSTFKRPEGYFAGKLIDEAGLRGYWVGGAQVSEKHCGFVINRKAASFSDIMGLCELVKRKVKETSGVNLEMEVQILG